MYGKPSISAKKIINLDTLEVFENLHIATDKTGIAWQNISKVCRGIRPKAGGFRWMFYDKYMSIPSQADDESEDVTTISKESSL